MDGVVRLSVPSENFLRRRLGAMARPIGAAVADVQVVPTVSSFFHGASSSAEVVVASKRAFWNLEDVLASVGIAKVL